VIEAFGIGVALVVSDAVVGAIKIGVVRQWVGHRLAAIGEGKR
jgi:hypothetical protein